MPAIGRRQVLQGCVGMVGTAALARPALASEFLTILTGGTAGVYYPLGVALSKIYAENIEGARTSVQATKASVENLNLLQAGRGELAFSLGGQPAPGLQGRRRGRLQAAPDQAARHRRHLPELHPGRRHQGLGHQDTGRAQGQAAQRRCA